MTSTSTSVPPLPATAPIITPLARSSSGVRLRPIPTATADTPASPAANTRAPAHTRGASTVIHPAATFDHDSSPAHLDSLLAPSSLDTYIALQNQQSSRGLEVVYGLKVELSRFYEELIDRGGTKWGPVLPYRVMGLGGVMYWKARREEQARRSQGTDAEREEEAQLAAQLVDPFTTGLPSDARPPPPISPETVLPAYVQVNMLKVAVRAALTQFEDVVEDLREALLTSQANEEQLRAELQEMQYASAAVPVSSPTMRKDRRPHPLATAAPPSPSIRSVAFADEYVSTLLSPRSATSEELGSPLSTSRSRDASPRPTKMMSPRGSISRRPSALSVLGAAAEVLLARSAATSGRAYHQDNSRGNYRGVGDVNMNTAREEQLERQIVGLEASITKQKETIKRLRDRIDENARTHQKEIVELSSKLSSCQQELSQTRTTLTQKGVLLNLESIARRQRQDHRQEVELHFARELAEAEKELRTLLDPKKELLFVRKVDAAATTTTSDKLSDARSARGGSNNTARTSKSAKKKTSTTTDTALVRLVERDANEGETTALVVADSSSSGLYPAAASPLVALEKSMKTTAGKQWLGKLLSPAPATTITAVVPSASPSPPPTHIEKSLVGHLLPGVDLLATDLLVVLDGLFHREYDEYARMSVDLSRKLKFERDLAERHDLIRTSPERIDMAVPPPPIVQQRPTTTIDLASLLAAIPSSSFAYLQAIQKLFLSLYNRLPHSIQQQYVELSQRMQQVVAISDADTRVKDDNEEAARMMELKPVEHVEAMTHAEHEDSAAKPSLAVDTSTNALEHDAITPTPLLPPALDATDAVQIAPSASSTPVALPSHAPPTSSSSFLAHAIASPSSPPVPRSSPSSSIDRGSHLSLARLELILHKIQSIANFRGLVIRYAK